MEPKAKPDYAKHAQQTGSTSVLGKPLSNIFHKSTQLTFEFREII